jgi:hypothetical protein
MGDGAPAVLIRVACSRIQAGDACVHRRAGYGAIRNRAAALALVDTWSMGAPQSIP